jgi:protein-disulfide isomerase
MSVEHDIICSMNNETKQKLVTPIAIVVAGVVIAIAIYLSGSSSLGGNKETSKQDLINSALKPEKPAIEVELISDTDHIRGSRDAKITIVEYSDTECPFCKRFHQTMKRIYDEYGPENKVAWVYRHFPLPMHKLAPKEAEAQECANEIGGVDAFWAFTDMVYQESPGNDGLDPAQLPVFAEKINIDRKAFETCLNSGKYADKISESIKAGQKAGARGTPYTVIFINNGGKIETVPLVDAEGNSLGSLPYEAMKNIVDKLLASVGA